MAELKATSQKPRIEKTKPTNDFFVDQKWRTSYIGFSPSKNFWYRVYRGFVLTVFVYSMLSPAIAAVLKPERMNVILALSSIMSNIYGFFAYICRLINHRCVKETCSVLKNGVYNYDYEDDHVWKLRESIPRQIQFKGNVILVIAILIVLENVFLFPAIQILSLPEGLEDPVVNPYFPMLFYQPYDTSSGIGFYSCFLMGAAFYVPLFTVAVAFNWIIMSFVVNVRTHFEILNHSLQTLEHRALVCYRQEYGKASTVSVEDLLHTPEFQRCLYSRLRSNIQHHQELLRLVKLLRPVYGFHVGTMLFFAPIVYGVMLYLFVKLDTLSMKILFLATFIASQYPALDMCYMGQCILDESGKLYLSLYSMDWWKYSKSFNLALSTVMCITLRPTGLTALIIPACASHEVYGDITTGMYKLCNLVRQSDVSV